MQLLRGLLVLVRPLLFLCDFVISLCSSIVIPEPVRYNMEVQQLSGIAKAAKNALLSSGDLPDSGSAIKSEAMDLTEDTICEECKSADNAENMLLCDKCDKGYHMACLSPPIKSVPAGDWFCQSCDLARRAAQGKASAGTGQKSPAQRVTDNDSDGEDFQPSKPTTRPTARQGSLLGVFCYNDDTILQFRACPCAIHPQAGLCVCVSVNAICSSSCRTPATTQAFQRRAPCACNCALGCIVFKAM